MEHLAVAQLPGAGGLSSAAFAPNPMVASSMAALSGSALVADELARDELRGGEKPGSDPADDDDDDDDDDDEDDGVGGKRKHGAEGEGGSKKKRLQRAHTGDKNNKGLRHFSMKVCNKVEEKTRTTYNEVADELVTEFVPSDGISPLDQVRPPPPHTHPSVLCSNNVCCCCTTGSLGDRFRGLSNVRSRSGIFIRLCSTHWWPRIVPRAHGYQAECAQRDLYIDSERTLWKARARAWGCACPTQSELVYRS